MSVLVSTCLEINKSCTNSSTAKQLYTFPKSDRFDKLPNLTSNIIPGDIKEMKSKYRGASLGYGKRPDFFEKSVKNKCDKFYAYRSEFDLKGKKTGNPSYSFGKKYNYDKLYDENIKFNYKPDQPGPGAYSTKYLERSPKFSFGGRNFNYPKKTDFPGSGAYDTEKMNNQGKYILSKISNINQVSFGSSKSPRFREIIKCKHYLT